ncbi:MULTISPECIES: DUF4192 domain-containing protein [Thermomonospora]|uniref:DUF4192 domain-containing protein n=1 Tax=Thermomonospora curvata (strain ATCC 19995 / DSM 43183 / JCM 3096 / KCTC 9072 / NBRC 15933 / NCIMB 10081 / Henssen B9) TaxID=471852 RepID=D1ABA9_THECD|nr:MULTISPECIES: DUF4192 domain-containing protein [Thermomonospora]ACY97145.1 hypothetical protein Tcur_1569 [Thermomonospora curvata DSM 43183]PKK15007.1 MAG: DUF4192 domain-containing protein [Thermomonospora sp. CIF 1]
MKEPMARTDRPALKIRSPHDAVSVVPYLLGFHPADSLVAIGFDGPAGTCAMRFDLPRSGAAELREGLAERAGLLLSRNGFRQVLLIGYGPAERVTPVIDASRRALAERGITVKEALRVADGRWWSYLCRDPGCCPPEGTAYDISASVIAAEATFAGHVAYADRSELQRTIAPLTGPARQAMRRATDRAEERLLSWAAAGHSPERIRARMVEEAVPLLADLTSRAGPPSDEEIAWLGVLLTNLRVRDEAWVRMDLDDPASVIAFWSDVLRRVETPYAAAPACLLAYAAYTTGDGGLANIALDRAMEADPAYSLALVLREVIDSAIPPSKARLKMTPEELAAAYAEQEKNAALNGERGKPQPSGRDGTAGRGAGPPP